MIGFLLGLCLCQAVPVVAETEAPGEQNYQPIALPPSDSTLPIFSRYPGLLPMTARNPQPGEWFVVPQLLLSSLMTNGQYLLNDVPVVNSFFDGELLSLGAHAMVGLGEGWSAGLQLKLSYLSGGFLDTAIDTFHGWFGFPTNGREKLPRDRLLLDLDTFNGFGFHRDQPVWMLADPVLALTYNLLDLTDLGLQFVTQLSLPLGLGAGLTGSDLPVLTEGVYVDAWPAWWLGLHAAIGVILPGEILRSPGASAMFQARLAVVGNFGWDILPYVEFTYQSSPIQTDIYEGDSDYFARPNSDLYFGIIIAWPEARQRGDYGAFTIQEDPFTHNGADVTFQGSGAFRLGH
jgi:hypothetical protein